jgi:hypothetical protein
LPSPLAAESAHFRRLPSEERHRRLRKEDVPVKAADRSPQCAIGAQGTIERARRRAAASARANEAMTYAAITGWGKCMPPSILTNADLASLMETDDEWITSRTGIKERRVSHVTGIELSHVARRGRSRARLVPRDVELIVYGSCSNDETVPNSASGVQLGSARRGGVDGHQHGVHELHVRLSTATAMIRTGVVSNAVVIGVELISQFMDWTNRGVAVLFGDGAAAVVLQATDREEGLIGEKLGCDADVRGILRVRGMGTTYAHRASCSATRRGTSTARKSSSARGRDGQCVAGRAREDASHGRRYRPRHPAPGEPADHRVGRKAHRRADGARLPHRAALRKHVVGDDTGVARRGAGGQPVEPGGLILMPRSAPGSRGARISCAGASARHRSASRRSSSAAEANGARSRARADCDQAAADRSDAAWRLQGSREDSSADARR